MSMKDKIKENIKGFKNSCGKNPRDKPLGKNPNLLSPNPRIIIIIEAAKADITLKNTPWYIKGFIMYESDAPTSFITSSS